MSVWLHSLYPGKTSNLVRKLTILDGKVTLTPELCKLIGCSSFTTLDSRSATLLGRSSIKVFCFEGLSSSPVYPNSLKILFNFKNFVYFFSILPVNPVYLF